MEPGLPIAPPSTQMVVDGRKLFASLVKVAIGGLTAWTEYFAMGGGALTEGSGIRAVGAAFADSLTAFGSSDANEGKAWTLISLSIASALDSIRPTSLTARHKREIKQAFRGLESEALAILADRQGAFTLTIESFRSPTHLPLYQRLRPALVKGAKSYLMSSARADKRCVERVGARLDSAFSAAVYEVMLTNDSTFASLQHAVFSPGHEAARREYDWRRYRSKLIEQFEVAPIPGQERARVALADLYVPLRATWDEPVAGGHVRACGMLHEQILQWLRAKQRDSQFRLIVGGPGAGKSTFAKALACELAKDPSLRPLYMPLHRLQDILHSPISDEYLEYLTKWGKFSRDPLSHAATNPAVPFVEIFDGLDELVRPGSSGVEEVAKRFVDWLDNHLQSLPRNAVAIITGRPVMMEAFEEVLPEFKPHHMLHIEGLAPLSPGAGAKIHQADNRLRAHDYRPEWWRRYALAVGADLAVPEVFTDPATKDLTNEPLLAYMVAVLGAQDPDWKRVTTNTADLYQTLLHKIWERGWGEVGGPLTGKRTGPGQRLTLDEFGDLMGCIAYAAWMDGSMRVATLDRFHKAMQTFRIKQSTWDRFREDMCGDLGALALTFYLRGSEVEYQGFEFTHKTFGEFLLARFLLQRFVKIVTQPKVTNQAALVEWLTLSGVSLVDKSVARFMRDLALLWDEKQRMQAIEKCAQLLTYMVTYGLPLDWLRGEPGGSGGYVSPQLQPGSSQDLNEIVRRTQVNFLSCLNALVAADRYHRKDQAPPLKISWPDQAAPARFISRLIEWRDVESTEVLGLSRLAFSSVDENGKVLFAPLLSGIYLAGASLTGSCFAGAQLDRANFSYADLGKADLTDADAMAADFTGAACSFTRFSRADLRRADFTEATLEYAKLDNALLQGADLRGANLQNALLRGADLRGANLTDADLRHANFSSARIGGARLPKAWDSLVTLVEGPPNFDAGE